ncbi:MAG: alpha/beta hydrolase [Oscillospiraceae bacterium]|nr:alpha/beta hydrolase [Oscillospiraceae bacterium]
MQQYQKPVHVNGHDMNVFITGNGTKTIVFLAGAMVTSPILEYKPLWEKLTEDFRIVILEKAGYGYSQGDTGAPRDVKNMTDESRQALEKAGIQPPYCLAPHSYSGLEAVYWASQYPAEVECILGLDMVTPPFALKQDAEIPAEKKERMAQKQGQVFKKMQGSKFRQKLYTALVFGQALVWKKGCLNDAEREEYKRLFFQNVCHSEMIEEQKMSTKNAQLVKDADLSGIPALLFISSMNARLKHASWKEENTAYAKAQGWQVQDAKSHQLYADQPDEIVQAWRKFVKN